MKKYLIPILGLTLLLGACSSNAGKQANKARKQEQRAVGNSLENQLRTQPVPVRPWSQLRQNLIEIETAQMDTTQTTSFFFNQGVQDPVQSCPSIGFPIPSTDQLTNPEQKLPSVDAVIPQIDPNGVYAGHSTGTYVMCIDAKGRAYADYWEGFVQTVTGPATWSTSSHSVDLVGPPSFEFSEGKAGK